MMVRRQKNVRRVGAIVPLMALVITALLGMTALAVDLGMIAIARNQCQNAADAAAMAAARSLNGNTASSNNSGPAQTAGTAVGNLNKVLGQAPASVNVTIGDYYYDTASQAFKISPSSLGVAGDNYTLAQATVTYQPKAFFSVIWGLSSFNTTATATAAHRPRDVAIIQDFSTSMRFQSYMGMNNNNGSWTNASSGAPRQVSMNQDTNVPAFGHYSAAPSGFLKYVQNIGVSTGETAGNCNFTIATGDGPEIVSDYSGSATAFGTSPQAWPVGTWPAPSTLGATPNGDVPQRINRNTTGAAYAKTVSDITGSSTNFDWQWELDGYAAYRNGAVNPALNNQTDYSNGSVQFFGYTQGPGYWGKTFFLWPPDPRVPWDPAYWGSATNIKSYVGNMVKLMTGGTIDPTAATGNARALLAPVAGTANTTNSWPGTGGTAWTSGNLATFLTTATGSGGLGLTAGAGNQYYERIFRLFNRGQPGGPAPTYTNNATFPADWRARFFFNNDGVTPLRDNSKMWSSTGNMLEPRTSSTNNNYRINYTAVLDWVNNTGPVVFPNQLRLGGIKYYDAIPSSINLPPANDNEHYWQELIDLTLGTYYTSGSGSTPVYYSGNVIDNNSCYLGYQQDFTWGTAASSAPPFGTSPSYSTFTPPSASAGQYMSYLDNPCRGSTKYWFGPQMAADMMANPMFGINMHSGTAHEAPTFQTKLGIQGAINDIQINHPNDNVAIIFFSTPDVYYQYPRVPLGKNYYNMINVQFFSPKVISTGQEITPYSGGGSDIKDVPRANGGTCYEFPLMLAHNQFSGNSSLVSYTANAASGTAGGLGRLGGTKLLIFETDGMINTGCAHGNFTSSTSGSSYWGIRITDANVNSSWESGYTPSTYGSFPSTPGTMNATQYPRSISVGTGASGGAEQIVQQMVADVANGGLSTQRKPVLIHCLAFGILFDPANNNTHAPTALQLLHNFESLGSVQPTSGGATPTSIDSNKIIYGNYTTRITKLQAAFQTIMQDAVQVTLISSNNAHTIP